MSAISYADRKDELNELLNAIFQNERTVIIFNTNSGYGITSFFHRVQWTLKTTNNIMCFNAELSHSQKSPIDEILKRISLKNDSLYYALQHFADDCYGEYEESLVKNILKDLPYLGETLSTVFDTKKASPIYAGYYTSILNECFFMLLSQLSVNKKIVIFIDGIEHIDNNSIYDIINLSKMNNVILILSSSLHNSFSEKLCLELEINSNSNVIYKTFGEPSIDCVKELGEVYAKKISEIDALRIKNISQNNIRKIICELKKENTSNLYYSDNLSQCICDLLDILNEGIDIKELMDILALLPAFNIYTYSEVETRLNKLESLGIITSIITMDKKHRFINKLNPYKFGTRNNDFENNIDCILYKNAIFTFLKNKETHSMNQLKLMQAISREFNYADANEWTQKLIIKSLQYGTNINTSLVDQISPLKSSYSKFICAICMMRTQRYANAVDILSLLYEKFPHNREIKKLLAVSLNRCRKHSDAETLLRELIDTSNNIDEQSVLLSFLVINLIHDGKESAAKGIVEAYQDNELLSKSKFWGYFLRNSATVFDDDISIEYWEKAAQSFKNNGDVFGEYSTVCNMARHYLGISPELSKQLLKNSFEKLQQFGIEKLNLVSNNLGIVSLYCDDLENTNRFLSLTIQLSKTIMPKAYAIMNMCALFISQDKSIDALNILTPLNDEIEKSNLNRLKAKYYLTLSTIYYTLSDYKTAKFYLSKADLLTFKYTKIRKNLLDRIVNEIPFTKIDWKEIFSPCFLEYWIIDPLILISDKPLPFETVDNDFFN